MKQILIKFPDDMEDNDAMKYISSVIKGGKISKHKGEDCYCFATVFNYDNVAVFLNERAKYPTFHIKKS